MSILSNTTLLNDLLEQANSLPDIENLDEELSTQSALISEQDAKIAELAEVLAGKAGGGGIEYEVITIPAGATSATYTLPRVTHAYGVLANSADMCFEFDRSNSYDEYGIVCINGVVPTVVTDASCSSTYPYTAYVESNGGFITYQNGTIEFVDGNVVFALTLFLLNDPNADAISR